MISETSPLRLRQETPGTTLARTPRRRPSGDLTIPTVRRRELGVRMRRLRTDSDLTVDEIAEDGVWSVMVLRTRFMSLDVLIDGKAVRGSDEGRLRNGES